jgi:ribosome-binding protein aMBF1 (putative translation factor)
MTPGQRIKMRLQKLDMTEEQLAEKIGMDPAHLLYIVNGQMIANDEQKTDISHGLHVKLKAIWKH